MKIPVNVMNETEPTGPVSVRSVPSEKLAIKERSEPKSPLARWLRAAQITAQIVFFIGCGAVAVALEQLMKIFRSTDGGGVAGPSNHSETRNARAQPQRIKVPMLPIDNYNQLDSTEVISHLAGLSDEQLRIVRAHEARQKNRGDVLEAIDRRLTGGR